MRFLAHFYITMGVMCYFFMLDEYTDPGLSMEEKARLSILWPAVVWQGEKHHFIQETPND